MKLSLVPLLALLTLAFAVVITAKARKDQSISGAEARTASISWSWYFQSGQSFS